jgi:hypothetical protein
MLSCDILAEVTASLAILLLVIALSAMSPLAICFIGYATEFVGPSMIAPTEWG